MRLGTRLPLTWLLWLLIALLPLRGWAFAQMLPTGPGLTTVASAMSVTAPASAAPHDEATSRHDAHHAGISAPPPHCHQALGLAPADPGDGTHHGKAAAGSCGLCAVCHAGLAAAPLPLALPLSFFTAEAPTADVGRALADGPRRALFRPPRPEADRA